MLFVPPPAESPRDMANVFMVPVSDLSHTLNVVAFDALYVPDAFQFAQLNAIP